MDEAIEIVEKKMEERKQIGEKKVNLQWLDSLLDTLDMKIYIKLASLFVLFIVISQAGNVL